MLIFNNKTANCYSLPLDGVAHLEDGLMIMCFEVILNNSADLEVLSKVAI